MRGRAAAIPLLARCMTPLCWRLGKHTRLLWCCGCCCAGGVLIAGNLNVPLVWLVASVVAWMFTSASCVAVMEKLPWHDALYFVGSTLTTGACPPIGRPACMTTRRAHKHSRKRVGCDKESETAIHQNLAVCDC